MTRITNTHRKRYRDYFAAKAREGSQLSQEPCAILPFVLQVAADLSAESLLDYGCGAARGISRFCPFPAKDYDPAFPDIAALPARADIVVCNHVLEHVEPECLDDVLAHLFGLHKKALIVVISTKPSTKVLGDGTPWHTIVRPPEWWREELSTYGQRQDPLPSKENEYGAIFYA